MGSTPISDLDGYNGESHDAEVALDRAGLRPQSEVVFIQSDKLTIKDPQFEAAVAGRRRAPCRRSRTSRTCSRRFGARARCPRTATPPS